MSQPVMMKWGFILRRDPRCMLFGQQPRRAERQFNDVSGTDHRGISGGGQQGSTSGV